MNILLRKTRTFLRKTILPIFIKARSRQAIKADMLYFESSGDFSDNARVLYDYMMKLDSYKNFQFVWLVDTPCTYEKKRNTIFLKRNTTNPFELFKRAKYINQCKFFFFTHPYKFHKLKNGQKIINLWHGCGYKSAKGHDVYFDMCIVPGPLFINSKAKFFNCSENKIVPIGYPRYNFLIANKVALNSKLEIFIQSFNLVKKEFKKKVLWMPTFRKSIRKHLSENTLNSEFDLPIIQDEKMIVEFNEVLKKNGILLILKQHRLQKAYNLNQIQTSNLLLIYDLDIEKNNLQLYEMLPYFDGLITDYSSVAFDYLIVNKPIAFILEDYHEYEKSRGFIFNNPLEFMPGEHIYNFDDLLMFINRISKNEDIHSGKREVVRKIAINQEADYCKTLLEELNINEEGISRDINILESEMCSPSS